MEKIIIVVKLNELALLSNSSNASELRDGKSILYARDDEVDVALKAGN